jgi:hypothetical protein
MLDWVAFGTELRVVVTTFLHYWLGSTTRLARYRTAGRPKKVMGSCREIPGSPRTAEREWAEPKYSIHCGAGNRLFGIGRENL